MRNLWLLILFLTAIATQSFDANANEIKVFYPENIGFLMERMKSEFEAKNPTVHLNLVTIPQMDLIGHAGDLLKGGDVLVVSDALLLQDFVQNHFSGPAADFISDEVVIFASPQAKHFDQLGERNWYFYLLKPEVKIAGLDSASPLSVRVPLCWKLSENWVKNMLVYEDFTTKLGQQPPVCGSKALDQLRSGEIDYAFGYLTQAKQSKLKFFPLMKYFNLGDPSLANVYKGAAVEFDFGAAGKKVIYGEPIIYKIGALKGSSNAEAARAFVSYVTGDEVKAILKEFALSSAL
jgi:molybdate/tungstate transport system substrate-binding protein